jgi:hypothetical protein
VKKMIIIICSVCVVGCSFMSGCATCEEGEEGCGLSFKTKVSKKKVHDYIDKKYKEYKEKRANGELD